MSNILYQSSGGGRFGDWRFGLSQIALVVSEDELEFSAPFPFNHKKFTLKKEEVERISLVDALFCWGIKIDHSNSETPKEVGFHVFSRKERDRLADVLRNVSYNVRNFG